MSGSIERLHLSFERFADTLTETLDVEGASDAEQSLLIEEVKVGCTLAMLQCLDRPHRLAYVLGEIMELSGPEAAEALDISPDLFRKRLQHARATVVSFTKAYCGLVDEARWALEVHRTSHPKASSVDFARRLVKMFDDRDDSENGTSS